MEIIELNEDNKVARGCIPAPVLRPDVEVALQSIIDERSARRTRSSGSEMSFVVTDRDGGAFDNLRFTFAQGMEIGSSEKLSSLLGDRRSTLPSPRVATISASTVSKRMKEATKALSQAVSPFEGFALALEEVLGLEVLGLMIEVADRVGPSQLSIGGAMLLGEASSSQPRVAFSAASALSIIRATQGLDPDSPVSAAVAASGCLFLKTYTDEVVGLALARQLPIVVSKAVSDLLSQDVLLTMGEDGGLSCRGPHFPSREAKAAFFRDNSSPQPSRQREQEQQQGQQQRQQQEKEKDGEREEKKEPKQLPPQEMTASVFLRMEAAERRAWLRSQTSSSSSSSSAMPRPREGLLALNAACYAVMEPEVVYEVLRRLAECGGDFSAAAAMKEYESKKPKLAAAILQAQGQGRKDEAERLAKDLERMGTLPYDPFFPSRPPLSADSFNVEEWFYGVRRRRDGS